MNCPHASMTVRCRMASSLHSIWPTAILRNLLVKEAGSQAFEVFEGNDFPTGCFLDDFFGAAQLVHVSGHAPGRDGW